jgi:hypothetical protein
MRKLASLTAALVLGVVATAGAATTLIDGFEDVNYTVVIGGLDPGTSIDLANVSGSEGTNALELTYTYPDYGQWYMGSGIAKEFTTAVDMSEIEKLSYDISIPAANAQFALFVYLEDEKGIQMRAVFDTGVFSAATTGFATKTVELSNFAKSKWRTGGKAINLKAIKKINIIAGNENGAVTAGSFVFSMDNMVFTSGNGEVTEVVLADFEDYADDSAIQADWAPAFSGATATVNTADAYAGTQSMDVTADVQAKWTSYSVKQSFATPVDLSLAKYMKIAMKGSATLSGANPTVVLLLEDINGYRAEGLIWDWPDTASWSNIYMPFNADGIIPFTDDAWARSTNSSCWVESRWDGGAWDTVTDLSQIAAIYVTVSTQADASPQPGPTTVSIDNIIAGYVAPVASDKNYTVIKTVSAPTIDGTISAGEWDTAADPGCTGFVAHDNPAVAATEDVSVKVMYDDTNLYLLLEQTTADISATWDGAAADDGTCTQGNKFPLYFAIDGNMGSRFYRVSLIPDGGDSNLYTWDEAAISGDWPGIASWDAANDSGAFSYSGGQLAIEYMIPWTDFNLAGAVITEAPANGATWGAQLGNSNENLTTPEFNNWEPDETAGYISGRPFGTWTFNDGISAVSAWELYN